MKTSRLCFVALISASLFSCKKDKPAPVFESIITGRVYEGNTMQGIKGSKIFLYKLDEAANRQRLDSVLTDDQGNYKLVLSTPDTLQGDYRWSFEIDKKYYSLSAHYNVKLGKTNTKDIPVYEPGILKARVIYNNLPDKPLRVSAGLGGSSLSTYIYHTFTKQNADTVVLLHYIPNRKHDIRFQFPFSSGSRNWYVELPAVTNKDTISRTYNLDFDKFWLSPW